MPRRSVPIAKWLLDNREIDPVTQCWNWTLSLDKDGYGRLKIEGRRHSAHRSSYIEFVGPVPDDLYICHKCDNRKCFNPDHLFPGMAKDSYLDMLHKGRALLPRGEDNGHSSLCADEVYQIRALAGGLSQERIGRMFGVGQTTVGDVIRRKSWPHVR